jgi:molybdopterin synthase sulfur carrier subunit
MPDAALSHIMKIHVKLFANFREVTRAKDVLLNVQGDTVRAAIDALVSAHPGLGPLMLHEGKVKPYVNVLLNGQTVKDISTHIKENDELALFPPVSGG